MDKLDDLVVAKALEKPPSVKVTVRARHIAAGVRGNSHHCPIARALKETGYTFVSVGTTCINLDGHVVPTPPEAHAFIRRFDDGRNPAPFSFDLDLKGDR